MQTVHTKAVVFVPIPAAVVSALAAVALCGCGRESSPVAEAAPPAAQAPASEKRSRRPPLTALGAGADQSRERAAAADEERVRRRAAAVAAKLELSAADEGALTDVLLQEQVRRAAALRELRRAPSKQAEVRAQLDDILAWKTRELQNQFGAELAAALMRR